MWISDKNKEAFLIFRKASLYIFAFQNYLGIVRFGDYTSGRL